MIKFAVLSGSRSGTSLVASTLNSHRDILCHGEIYHPNSPNHLRGTLAGLSVDDVKELRKDMDGFLAQVFDQPGYKAAGFKIWQRQSPDAVEALMADTSVKKIIYERCNIFARFASSRLATATGVFNVRLEENAQSGRIEDARSTKVQFERKQFLKYMNTHKAEFQHFHDNAKGDVLDTSYGEVVSGGFGPILDFLGVARAEMIPQRQKLHSSDILSRFEPAYHDIIREVLDEIGHPEWVHE